MKFFQTVLLCGLVTTTAVAANKLTLPSAASEITTHAARVQRGAEERSNLLTKKPLNASLLEERLSTLHQDIQKMKQRMAFPRHVDGLVRRAAMSQPTASKL